MISVVALVCAMPAILSHTNSIGARMLTVHVSSQVSLLI